MPKKIAPMTDIQAKKLKAKDGKPATLFDGEGLYLLAEVSGSKGWRLKYRLHGKQKLTSLGAYPETSLADARKLRTKARKLIKQGTDPIQTRTDEKQLHNKIQENTFKKIAMEWHNNQTNLAATTKQLHMRRLERDILPTIGGLPISEISPKLILDKVLRPMEARGVGEMTARVKSIISQVFRFGVACGYTERDITTDLTGALKKVTRGHRAAVTEPIELAKLLRTIDNYDGYQIVKYALQLIPLIFVRPGELRAMRWADIDFKNAEWRYLISKTNTEHIVPLSKQSLEILKSIQPLSGTGTLVFPSIRSTTRPISDNTLNAALRRMGYSKDEVTAHGFRATARTILEEVLQERVEYIEHQLAHSVRDSLGRAYNRTKHLKQRHRMMQIWADYLDNLKTEVKIIPLHQNISNL